MGVVGPDREAAFLLVEFEDELPRLELDAVLVAEQRHEQLVVEVAAVRVPVDVEPSGMSRIRAPFQHVEPERIVGAADAHMVRHEIEHLLRARSLASAAFIRPNDASSPSSGLSAS